jgi:hypothetical protein
MGTNLGVGRAISPDTSSFKLLTISLAIKLAKSNIALDWKIFKFFQDMLKNGQHRTIFSE